jgi:hypothetical protein
MPTSGTNRPGPIGMRPQSPQSGIKPVQIAIERLGIAAPIEALNFSNEAPSLPETPESVAWYPRSTPLGIPGVVLIGGSSAVADTGPSAFTRLSEVLPEDIVLITGVNGGEFQFAVAQSEPLSTPPDFASLLQENAEERLMLLAWQGVFASAIATGGVHLVAGTRVMITPLAG